MLKVIVYGHIWYHQKGFFMKIVVKSIIVPNFDILGLIRAQIFHVFWENHRFFIKISDILAYH